MAPRRVPHKRGGTHRVKDEDRTNTIYDEWDYKQLKNASIERSVYVKDMKKVEMAKALARADVQKRRADHSALVEYEKKKRKFQIENQKVKERRLAEEATKHKRRMDKVAKRERDESVSDDTPDEEEIRQMHDMMVESDEGPVGRALSEESWDSTSTETSIRPTDSTVLHDCKLRLFEWPFIEMPSPTECTPPTSSINSSDSRLSSPNEPDKRTLPIPRNIPYAPLKVHTTKSKEKLFLPGQTYPPGIDTEFVPLLSGHTRDAARNGILEGVLRKAKIERASTWNARTQIQGSTSHIFFSPAPRNKGKSLMDVYNRWYLENRKLLRVEPRGNGLKVTREQRHTQIRKNKGRQLAEVFEASEYRPTAVCYLPAYLDYRTDTAVVVRELQNERRTLDNLFFIRFPGCDVPHYYFWTREREWADPTVPNPDWSPETVDQCTASTDDEDTSFQRPRVSQKRLPGTSPVRTILSRVKNAAHRPQPPPSCTISAPDLGTIVAQIEFELYTHGLSMTLAKYRNIWLKKGKTTSWNTFSRYLPLLYPSGTLPIAPPLKAENAVSVAMKLASIEKLGDETCLDPLTGDEPWTQNDDVWWDVKETNVDTTQDLAMPILAEAPPETSKSSCELNSTTPKDLEALNRRESVLALPYSLPDRCASWLDKVSPAFDPLTPDDLPRSPTIDEADTKVREAQGTKFPQDVAQDLNVKCPFCVLDVSSMSIEHRAEHMYSHNTPYQASHGRASPIELPPLSLAPDTRKRNYRIDTSLYDFDTSADADTEETPRMDRFRSHSPSISQNRRTFPKTRIPSASAESSRFPSPHFPPVKHAEKETCTSGKPDNSTVNSRHDRASETPKHHVHVTESIVGKHPTASKTNTMDCGNSKMLGPTCHASFTLDMKVGTKRKSAADLTYRASLARSASTEDGILRRDSCVAARKKCKTMHGWFDVL